MLIGEIMGNLSLKNKLLLLAVLPLIVLLISFMAGSYYLEKQNQQQNFNEFKTKLIADKQIYSEHTVHQKAILRSLCICP